MRRPPKLRQHKTGVYFVTRGREYHYFSKDKRKSELDYASWVATVWAPAQADKPASRKKTMTVQDLAHLYLSWVSTERSPKLFQDYRSYLRPLVALVPTLPADKISVRLLDALKTDMRAAGYKPPTINHTLKAAKRMCKWGSTQGLISPLDLTGLEMEAPIRQGKQTLTTKQVSTMLQRSLEADRRLTAWLAIGYLSCARPSEVVRLAHGDGQWAGEGVYQMQSKTWRKTGLDRFLLLSPEAMTDWLPQLEPHWKTWTSFSERVRETCGMGGPRQLRAAGATHLRQAGVSYSDVRLALGHTERGEVVRYVEEDFSTVLPLMGRLTLRSVPVQHSS